MSRFTISLIVRYMLRVQIFCILVYLINFPAALSGQTAEEFAVRRQKLMEGLAPNDIILIVSAPEVVRNGDVNYEYRQSSNLYYLTGFTEPNSVLVLSPGRKLYDRETRTNFDEILYIQSPGSAEEIWTGPRPTVEKVLQEWNLSCVHTIDKYEPALKRLLKLSPTFYLDIDNLSMAGTVSPYIRPLREARNHLYPLFLASIRDRIGKMREIKSPAEIENIKKAIDITGEAVREAARRLKPGMYEYEVEALIEYTFRRSGSERCGFPSIVGSGPNTCILHYEKNNRLIQDGDLLLMDIGAEWKMYTADITRTLPASGKFTPRQKKFYSLVLRAQREAMSVIRPGIPRKAVHNKAVEILSKGMKECGLVENKSDYRKYYMHGTSHFLGLDVHDINISDTLRAGMVLTVEPGIYIREEEIGIRIEDDVLVTEDGFKVLSENIPVTIEEIERLMAQE